jgi:octaprenyl-diphosphate synthase
MSEVRSRIQELLAPIESEMEAMNKVLQAQLGDDSPAVRDMTSHVGRFSGKQLRAALVLLVADATGRKSSEHVKVAAIVEMIHLATLVHDDVLDGAEVRRRVACVNERWDNQTAILLGDFLYSRAFGLSTTLKSGLTSRLLASTTSRLCAGEIEQSTQRYDFELTQERYEFICAAKTASLYGAACELGARVSEQVNSGSFAAEDELATSMACFGEELGLAFQIIDDCLDLVGDAEIVGKSVGTDVEDGKVTLPVLHVYASASEETRTTIRDIYTKPDFEKRAVRLREAVDLTAGLEYAKARAEALVDRAMTRLDALEESPARQTLKSIGDFVLGRNW